MVWAVLAACAATSGAEPAVEQVLMLQSFDRGILVFDHFTADLRLALDERLGKPVNIVQVVVGPSGSVAASEGAVVDYIQALYAERAPPDLIVTVGGPAAVFTRAHRQRLFPQTPLLYAAVDERWLRTAPLADNESTAPVSFDVPRLVDDMLQVLPETKQVFMIVGSGTVGRFWHRQLEAELARFRDRLTFDWSDTLTFAELMQRCAALPRHSAMVWINFGSDVKGGLYADERVLAELRATASAPLFSPNSPFLGQGVVGGSMVSIEELAGTTADVIGRILDGVPPASLRLAPKTASRPVFDWREMKRWGIAESRLPAGSDVKFRGPNLWSEYRLAVLLSLGVLVLQTALIARLLYERRARLRAELESRRSLVLAADANRRETMTALTNSIGHELGQPLTALMHNTQALRMMVKANQATQEALGELLNDIQAEAVLATQIIDRHRSMLRGRELDRRPVDLGAVVEASLALLAHELRLRQIETALDMPPMPCVVDGDQVLLQQVVVNVVRNAIDAMADTPAALRRLAIRGSLTAGDVEISIRDSGSGLPPEVMETLFTPFVTTKTNGLGVGLAITRSIVDAHGGTIAAHANRDGGATFTLRLPQSAARRPQAPPRHAELEN